uniref:Reverse transcriptase domain-containing protein n=1 Tax=Leptobrachium leishanense TaxID=445787 RepID=A0A8C5PGP4_9ANUR
MAYIPKIKTVGDAITLRPEEISAAFRSYYASLYHLADAPPPMSSLDEVREYIETNLHTRLQDSEVSLLDKPISKKELLQALKSTKNGKSPGPDGLPAEYYKEFQDLLLPPLLATLNALNSDTPFHPHTLCATITVLPKPGKDPAVCESYRPISLLNSDVKLLARVLADRLKLCLPRLVHPDQVGFIPGREARDGTQRVLNAVVAARNSGQRLLLLSTDAEKAFDRVSWPFLFQTLRSLGIGPGFLAWTRALYTSPTARVKVNGALSDSFQIFNGTRQGCPLSPLLFALSLEPFLEAVRRDPAIPGIKGVCHTHKISAYADDMLFFLTDALNALPAVVAAFERYGRLAGMKINMTKSEILNISLPAGTAAGLAAAFPFHWCKTKMKYLGIWISPSLQDLYALNFQPLLGTLRGDLAEWNTKFISWMGRVAVFKMNILPRLLYLFQTVPVAIPGIFFKSVRSDMIRFVWAGRRPRLSVSVMYRPKEAGGLALPDLVAYHRAAQLTRLVDWTATNGVKRWLDLEGEGVGVPLWSLPWLPHRAVPKEARCHPLVGATMRLWDRLKFSHSLSSSPSPLLPLSSNPLFSPGIRRTLQQHLTDSNRLLALHVAHIPSLQALTSRPDLPPLSFLDRFNFQQIRHYLSSLQGGHALTRALSPFERLCTQKLPLTHGISTIYALLQSKETDPPPYMGRWEAELNITMTEADWSTVLFLTHHGTRMVRYHETSYKILVRWYCTPLRLFQCVGSTDPNCWRCGEELGSYLHIWWYCSPLQNYWKWVGAVIREITDLTLEHSPQTFLLLFTGLSTASFKKSVAFRLLLAARQLIPRHWKRKSVPSLREWTVQVEEMYLVEERIASHEGTHQAFGLTWFYWRRFVDSTSLRNRLAAELPTPT